MTIEIVDCVQGTPEWYTARCGVVTASKFSDVMAKGEGKVRRSYMYRLAGERITGVPAETYRNADMERGQEMEAEARSFYAMMTSADLKLVGFIKNGNKGCSPDALIPAENGGLEIKTCQPSVLVEYLMKAAADPLWFPPEHKAQLQGNILVAELKWIDLCCYSTAAGIPPLVRRIEADSPYILAMGAEVLRFNEELEGVIKTVKGFGA